MIYAQPMDIKTLANHSKNSPGKSTLLGHVFGIPGDFGVCRRGSADATRQHWQLGLGRTRNPETWDLATCNRQFEVFRYIIATKIHRYIDTLIGRSRKLALAS